MEKKQVQTFRLDPETIKRLKTAASMGNTSVSEIITRSLELSAENAENAEKIKALEDRIRSLTKDKTIRKRRVSIGLSNTEYYRLKEMANKLDVSKSELIRHSLFSEKKTKLMLESA